MSKKETGSIVVTVLLILLVCVIGLAGWRLYSARHSSDKSTAATASSNADNSSKTCGNDGIIIVQFSTSSTKERQLAIISEEHVTVHQIYKNIPGLYALNVGSGNEQSAVNK